MVEKCYIPSSLEEALKIRRETGARPLAGGSDLMVQYKQGIGITPAFPFPVMIISKLEELRGIRQKDDGSVEIMALATPDEIAHCPFMPWHVKNAASRMGAIALRNTATIGGNIGNASPKGDLPQPLILLDAEIVLRNCDEERIMPLDEFILGSKKTALRDDEIIYKIIIPPVSYSYAYYRKIGTRKANAISKLSLSSLITIEEGVITDFRAASGAAGPKVIRSRESENILKGKRIDEVQDVLPSFLDSWNDAISPHAMPQYRRNTTRRMLEHFILAAAGMPENQIIE